MNREMPIVFLDTETTGLDPDHREVIDIWARLCMPRFSASGALVGLEHIAEAGGLVTPTHIESASPIALRINGYTPERWADSRPWRQVWYEVEPLLEGARIVGSNPAFDVRFIDTMNRRHGLESEPLSTHHSIDTCSMAHRMLMRGEVDSAGLSALVGYFGLEGVGEPHTARGDVARTDAVYRCLLGVER